MTLEEFKLAFNSKLKQNLAKQVDIYKAASSTERAIKVIIPHASSSANAQGVLLFFDYTLESSLQVIKSFHALAALHMDHATRIRRIPAWSAPGFLTPGRKVQLAPGSIDFLFHHSLDERSRSFVVSCRFCRKVSPTALFWNHPNGKEWFS